MLKMQRTKQGDQSSRHLTQIQNRQNWIADLQIALKGAITNTDKQNQQEAYELAQALYNIINDCARSHGASQD